MRGGQTSRRPSRRPSRRARTAFRRALGAALCVALVGCGWLTYAAFNQVFVPVETVTLHTSHAGLQLERHADVKLRGMLVGEVRRIDVDPDGGARLELALDPETIGRIPADIDAVIVPKTLFGEKYVALEPVERAGSATLTAGAVIGADRTRVATELEQVLDDAYPLLTGIRPARLNTTLSAMATALEGRGDELGAGLERLNAYLGDVEPHVSTLVHDLDELGAVAELYRTATPDLIRLLDNTRTTGGTIVEREEVLAAFLTELAESAETAGDFLAENEADLLALGEIGRPILDLLARYSPQYPCLLQGMVDWLPRFNDSFGLGEHFEGSAPALHITLELVPQRPGYERADRPVFGDDRGPGCRTLPNPPYSQENPGPGSGVETGVRRR